MSTNTLPPFVPDALVIRTTGSDGAAYGGFQWPREVGAIVTAPDWDPAPICGHGLHGLLDGDGNWSYLSDASDALWWIVEVVRAECVVIDGDKVKFPRCRVKSIGQSAAAVREIMAAHRARVAEIIAEAMQSATATIATADETSAVGHGVRGHASSHGVRGHASSHGDSGHASSHGVRGHASSHGDSGHASSHGDSGHASSHGDSGHASSHGDSGHASSHGVRGHASSHGYRGHASSHGYRGHASSHGVRGHASSHGDSGHASSHGVRGHASSHGDSGHASSHGVRGHASSHGDSGHASSHGDSGHASSHGDSGHASVAGKQSIAAALGPNSRAKAGADGWIVCTAWNIPDRWDQRTWSIACVKAAKVGGPEGIKPDTWYALSFDGVFEEVAS